MKRGLSEG